MYLLKYLPGLKQFKIVFLSISFLAIVYISRGTIVKMLLSSWKCPPEPLHLARLVFKILFLPTRTPKETKLRLIDLYR